MAESLVGRKVRLTGPDWNHPCMVTAGTRIGQVRTVTMDGDGTFVQIGGVVGFLSPTSGLAVEFVPERFDQSNPIYASIGIAHWAVYKDADADPEYPWFVEHRLVKDLGDLRRPHDEDEHEYGSFEKWEHAYQAALAWFDAECRLHEDEHVPGWDRR